MEDTLKNIVKRLKPFEYLNSNGLYNALHLRQLSQEIETIHQTASEAHQKNPNKETRKLLNEVCFLRFKTWWTQLCQIRKSSLDTFRKFFYVKLCDINEIMQRHVKHIFFCFSKLAKAREDIQSMNEDNFFNLEAMKTRLRDLNNRAQTCKTIPDDFRSKYLCDSQ